MSINNIEIKRVYRCCNHECEGVIQVTQKISDDFLKQCPFCNENELIIENAKLNLSFFIDTNKPKTYGSQSDLNTKEKEKMFGKKPVDKNKPWYRKNDKVDFNILKNPKKYIMEGNV